MSAPTAATGSSAARAIVDRHERSLPAAERRRLGAHYTPEPLARRLMELAAAACSGLPRVICDPCCGAGAVLLAAADHLASRGVEPGKVVAERLLGVDIDPEAAAAAREALVRWARDHGVRRPPEPAVVVADSLAPAQSWAGRHHGRIDLVVGNPPFLSQLAVETAFDPSERLAVAGRFGDLGAYTDAAAVHLLGGLEAVGRGGVVCLLQPQSVLGARDAGPVRRALVERAALVGLWATDELPFEAQVAVCAPVLRRLECEGGHEVGRAGTVQVDAVRTGAVRVSWRDSLPTEVSFSPDGDGSWSPLLASALGVPPVAGVAPGTGRVSDVATVTAGFRDEFYALAAAAHDRPAAAYDPPAAAHDPRLVTVGMIDPGRLAWGTTPRRLAGRAVIAPRVDLAELDAAAPRVARWAVQRLGPKVLVASQTKVLEAVVDAAGDCVPVTPVVSVEPTVADVTPVMLAAALSSPSVSVRLATVASGTGLSTAALRVGARAVGGLPLPGDPRAWAEAATAWVAFTFDGTPGPDRHAWAELGRALDAAHGVDDPALLEWWLDRLPALRPRGRGRGQR